MKINNEQISEIKNLLLSGNDTFVSKVKGNSHLIDSLPDTIYSSTKKGIAPIMDALEKNRAFFGGAIIADRVIGKAAAMLLIDSGALFIYGEMTSEHALKILENAKKSNPDFSYEVGKVVPYIINRTGDDMCPMEKTVLSLENPADAYEPLKAKLESMKSN